MCLFLLGVESVYGCVDLLLYAIDVWRIMFCLFCVRVSLLCLFVFLLDVVCSCCCVFVVCQCRVGLVCMLVFSMCVFCVYAYHVVYTKLLFLLDVLSVYVLVWLVIVFICLSWFVCFVRVCFIHVVGFLLDVLLLLCCLLMYCLFCLFVLVVGERVSCVFVNHDWFALWLCCPFVC